MKVPCIGFSVLLEAAQMAYSGRLSVIASFKARLSRPDRDSFCRYGSLKYGPK